MPVKVLNYIESLNLRAVDTRCGAEFCPPLLPRLRRLDFRRGNRNFLHCPRIMCSPPHTWKQIKSVTHWIGRWHIELFSTFPDEIYLASIPPSPPLASNGVLSSSRYSPRCGTAPQISLAFVSRGICLKREYKESFSFGPRVPPHHSKIEEPCLSPGQDEGEQDQHHIICDWLAVPLVLEHLWRTWWNFPNYIIFI